MAADDTDDIICVHRAHEITKGSEGNLINIQCDLFIRKN